MAAMPAAVALPVVQGTPEWVDARRDVIGSSDIPILTDSSPYGTSKLTLFAVKTRLIDVPDVDDATRELWALGHALEPVIAERYVEITGRPVRRRRHLLVHPTERWMGASLDRVSARRGERRIIEVKWVPHRRWVTDGPEPIPAYVQDQVQWQLAVTGYDVADVAVLNGSRVEVHEIEPNTAYQDDLRVIAEEFYARCQRGERPPIDGSDSTTATIRRLHARDTLGLMPPNAEVAGLAHALRDAAAAKRAATEEDARIRNELRWLLGDWSGVEDDDYRIHNRRSADRIETTIDWEGIAGIYRETLEALRDLAQTAEPWPPDVQAVVERPDVIESLRTTTEHKEGRRALIPKFRDEETGRWV